MKISYSLSLIILISICSCGTKKDLVYFSDLSGGVINTSQINNNIEPVIQQNDVLDISVNTPSQEFNVLFAVNPTSTSQQGTFTPDGYKVDKDGNINYPVIGAVKLKGLTIEQAQQKLMNELNKYVKEPIVNVKYLNFRITVIGEVNRPETFIIPNERINLLEALGRAGDMTPYGRRENVLVIREIGGERTMVRLNLNKKSTLNSPFFYLMQNDVVYVEPDKTKAIQYSNSNRLLPVWLSLLSAGTVILSAYLFNN